MGVLAGYKVIAIDRGAHNAPSGVINKDFPFIA